MALRLAAPVAAAMHHQAAAGRAPRAVPGVRWRPPTSDAACGAGRGAGRRRPAPPPPPRRLAAHLRPRRRPRRRRAAASAPAARSDRTARSRPRPTMPTAELTMARALALPRPRRHAPRCGPRRSRPWSRRCTTPGTATRPAPTRWRAAARTALDEARERAGRGRGLRARRGRVHERRHRGRQPRGRAGVLGARDGHGGVHRHRAPGRPRPGRPGRWARRARRRPRRRRPRCACASALDDDVALVSVDAGEQRGRAPSSRWTRSPSSCATVRHGRCSTPTPSQAALLARRPGGRRGGRPDHARVAQVRRTRSARGRSSCAVAWPSSAQQLGGGQERERRSGTQDVAGAVGFAAAAVASLRDRARLVDREPSLARPARRRPSWPAVPGPVESAVPSGATRDHLVAGVANVCLPAVDSEALLFLLEHEHARAGQRRVELCQRRPGAVARARRARHRAEPGRRLTPAVARVVAPPTADIDGRRAGRAHGRSAVCRTTPATEPRRDRTRARRDVGRRRLVGRRRPARGGRPRGGRRHA